MIIIEGAEKIKSKILQEAKKEVERITSETDARVKEIKEDSKRRVEAYKKEKLQKIESEMKLFLNKEIASAEMEGRKKVMEKREELISSIIDEAISKINKAKAYETFLKKTLIEFSGLLGKNLTIRCNEKDTALIKKLSKGKIIKHPIDAGIILEGEDGRVDMSIDAIFSEKEKNIRKKIVEVLGA